MTICQISEFKLYFRSSLAFTQEVRLKCFVNTLQAKKASVFFIDFGNCECIDLKLLILIDDRIIQQVCFWKSKYSGDPKTGRVQQKQVGCHMVRLPNGFAFENRTKMSGFCMVQTDLQIVLFLNVSVFRIPTVQWGFCIKHTNTGQKRRYISIGVLKTVPELKGGGSIRSNQEGRIIKNQKAQN